MNNVREWTDIALIALAASYKWVLGVMAVAAVVAGGLFAAGAFSGGDGSSPQAVDTGAPTAASAPPPTAMPLPTHTPMPTPTATPFPTLAPSPTATPEPPSQPAAVAPSMVQVPINLKGAYQVGSLELVMTYEPSLLEVTGVTNGELAGNAVIESRVSTPGKVWIAVINADGVTGDGPVALVSFRMMKGDIANSPLLLDEVSSFNASTLLDLLSTSSPGLVVMNDGSYTPPQVVYE